MVNLRLDVPAVYHNRRNLTLAYTDGFRAGTAASSPHAAPLRLYVRESSQAAYEHGFGDAQRVKRSGATA